MKGRAPLDGPVHLTYAAILPIPTSWSKKKRELAAAGGVLPTGRPDTENLVKTAMDAMNGVVYLDDSQVVSLVAQKRYGHPAGVELEVAEVA